MTSAEREERIKAVEAVPAYVPPLHLPFNGRLSPDEFRMAEQGAFDDPCTFYDDEA